MITINDQIRAEKLQNDINREAAKISALPSEKIHKYEYPTLDGKNFFDQPVNSNLKTYENIRRIAAGQGDDYTTGCLLDYSYFKEHYKMIVKDLSKQQVLDADPRAIQQINFTANLDRRGNTTMFFIIEEAKETMLDFSQGSIKVLQAQLNVSSFIFISIR